MCGTIGLVKNPHVGSGVFEFYAIGSHFDSPASASDDSDVRLGSCCADISRFELKRNATNSKLEIRNLNTTNILGPENRDNESRYQYFPSYVGVGKINNEIVTCGFVEKGENNYDLSVTYMPQGDLKEPWVWSEANPQIQYCTNESTDEKCEINTGFLPYAYERPRGLSSGLYIERKGTYVIGTEYIYDQNDFIIEKRMRVAFVVPEEKQYCWT